MIDLSGLDKDRDKAMCFSDLVIKFCVINIDYFCVLINLILCHKLHYAILHIMTEIMTNRYTNIAHNEHSHQTHLNFMTLLN